MINDKTKMGKHKRHNNRWATVVFFFLWKRSISIVFNNASQSSNQTNHSGNAPHRQRTNHNQLQGTHDTDNSSQSEYSTYPYILPKLKTNLLAIRDVINNLVPVVVTRDGAYFIPHARMHILYLNDKIA